MNLKIISNAAYIYLKDEEYFIITKYIKDNYDYINNAFTNLELRLKNELGIKRKEKENTNSVKDYLLSFNNTINIKIKNIFDEMNLVVSMDNNEITDKIKNYNDKVSHIYETKLVFDKKFLEYKKEFDSKSHDNANFKKIFEEETKKITEYIKGNISNIFRENIKIYNDITYKTVLLKSRINEFDKILSPDKAKDLLLK